LAGADFIESLLDQPRLERAEQLRSLEQIELQGLRFEHRALQQALHFDPSIAPLSLGTSLGRPSVVAQK
ncbi:MAG: hypothetical protein ACP5P4_12140, partial [Steroidobacteraceae bacterium]